MYHEEYVAIKVGIANSLLSQDMNCLQGLSTLSAHPGRGVILSRLDEFEIHGPNGLYSCYTMIPAPCKLRGVSFSRLFPLDVARALVGGLVMAIAHMHSCGNIHGGLFLSLSSDAWCFCS